MRRSITETYALLSRKPVAPGPLHATLNGNEIEIAYAGAAPGHTAAVTKINLRLPANLSPGDPNFVIGFGAHLIFPISPKLS